MSIPLHVYNQDRKNNGKPRPMLWLREDDAAVCAVTEEGRCLAVLWLPDKDAGIETPMIARDCIEDEGYDTSWAEWRVDGRFVRWAE